MPSRAARDRLTLPVAAIVALGLVSIPPDSSAALPRLTEVAAVRLQAEVTSLVSGVAAVSPAPAAAGSAAPSAGSYTYNPSYTWIDNVLMSLPTNVRNALIPPLYAVAWVLGAAIAVATLVATPIIKLFNPKATFPFTGAAVRAPAASTLPDPVAVTAGSGNAADRVGRAPAAPAGVAAAVAAARRSARARILAAVPATPPVIAPAPKIVAPVEAAIPARDASETPGAANDATDVVTDAPADPAPAAAVSAPGSIVNRVLRGSRSRATGSPDSAPAAATPRAKRSVR